MTLVAVTFVKRRKECWSSWGPNSQPWIDSSRRYRLSYRGSANTKTDILECENLELIAMERVFQEANHSLAV